jgi:hypothetical protein
MAAIVFRKRPQSSSATKRDAKPPAEPKSLDDRIATAITAGLYMHCLGYDATNKMHTFTPLPTVTTPAAAAEIVLITPASTLSGVGASANPVVFHSLCAGKHGVYVRHLARADASRLAQLTKHYKPVAPTALCVFHPAGKLKKGTSQQAAGAKATSEGAATAVAEGEAPDRAAPKMRMQSFISIKLPPEGVVSDEALSPSAGEADLCAIHFVISLNEAFLL